MRPYSRREIRGLLLLGIVCLLCVGIGVMARQGWFRSSTSREFPVSTQISSAPDTVLNVSAGEVSTADKSRRDRRTVGRRKSRGKRRRSENGGVSVAPARDILADTIRDN